MTVLRVAVLLCVFLIQRAASQGCTCQSDIYISIDDLVKALNNGPCMPGLIDNQNSCSCNQPSCGNRQSFGNQQSCGCNQQPCGCNQQPCGCNKQPCGCNQKPCGCNQQSCGCNQQSCGCNQQPCGCNQQPCGCNQQSCGCNQQPCGCNQQSCGCNQQSCGCNQQSQSISRPISIGQVKQPFNNQCGCQPSVSISQPCQQCGCQPSVSISQPCQQCGCQPSVSISQPCQQCGCQPSVSFNQPSQQCGCQSPCGCQSTQSLTISNPSISFQPVSGQAIQLNCQPQNQGNQVSEICIVPAALLQAPPYGIIFAGDNLLVDGAVQVCGNLPFSSIVELSGVMPTSGSGCVQYVCDDSCPC